MAPFVRKGPYEVFNSGLDNNGYSLVAAPSLLSVLRRPRQVGRPHSELFTMEQLPLAGKNGAIFEGAFNKGDNEIFVLFDGFPNATGFRVPIDDLLFFDSNGTFLPGQIDPPRFPSTHTA